jgi:N-methylhydantoinase A
MALRAPLLQSSIVPMYRVGVDIGGTFTDVVVARESGGIVRAKALTTPGDYTDGVMNALENAATALEITLSDLMGDCVAFVNGTTVVTNSIATQAGRRVGLLTTRGFKQQIYIHRGIRRIQLDLQKEARPPDIVPQRRVAEVDERVNRAGEVLVALDEDGVRDAVTKLVEEEGIEALAVCYLWAFRHPQHERRTGELVEELYPDLFVTLSSDIYPRIREYERMNTAVLNSFVSEGAETYIGKLTARAEEQGLGSGSISFMQSLGGHIPPRDAMAEPIHLSHSGPVGGVVAATHFASVLGESDVITADVGGTSFDTALIRDGRPAYAHRTTINRLLTGLSTVDIHAIGAGGGSIAWIDTRGIPQLGPRSAGAFPGPACYGNGGEEPTITDANLLLGLIDPDKFWGGAVKLDLEAAERAFVPLADRLGRSVADTAAGYHEIAVTHMSTAMSTVSLGRGYDPRDFTVVGYGGGAGLFLAEVCQELGIGRLVMPRAAATFSAYGLLFADAIHSKATTVEWDFMSGSMDAVNDRYGELEAQAFGALRSEGFEDDRIEVRREADVKFIGQSFEISMTMPSEQLAESDRDPLAQRFLDEYERVYGAGTAWEGFPIQLQTARVVAIGKTDKPPVRAADGDGSGDATPSGERTILTGGQEISARAYDGPALAPGAQLTGPALIDDVDTTLFVPDGVSLAIDDLDNYVFSIRAEPTLAATAGAGALKEPA